MDPPKLNKSFQAETARPEHGRDTAEHAEGIHTVQVESNSSNEQLWSWRREDRQVNMILIPVRINESRLLYQSMKSGS